MFEVTTYSHLWLICAALLLVAWGRWRGQVAMWTVRTLLVLAVAKIVFVDILACNPMIWHQEVGTLPVLNYLLYYYGLPVLLLLLLGRLPGDEAWKRVAAPLALYASLFTGAVLVSFEVRQYFHGASMGGGRATLYEISTYSHAWMLLAALLLLGWSRWGSPVALWGARVLAVLAGLKLVFLDVLACNPLIWHQSVGDIPLLNGLLYVYGLPILFLIAFAKLPGDEGWRKVAIPAALYGGLGLGLVLLTLEVRQFFHHPFLDAAPLEDMENYAYSAVWILFALLLLGVGIALKGKGPRVASLVVMFLAVSKVFVYDLRHLTDLYRVGSFMALGLSLLLISYLYQRFVFRAKGNEES